MGLKYPVEGGNAAKSRFHSHIRYGIITPRQQSFAHIDPLQGQKIVKRHAHHAAEQSLKMISTVPLHGCHVFCRQMLRAMSRHICANIRK